MLPPTSQNQFAHLYENPANQAPAERSGEPFAHAAGQGAPGGRVSGTAGGQPAASPHYRSAPVEILRSYSFDLREIVAVIPQEMQSGARPATPRLILQLPPEALDSTGNYLGTSLSTICRACPVLFVQPVSRDTDRMVVLSRPSEGIDSPFRIVGNSQQPGAQASNGGAAAHARGVQAALPAQTQSAGLHPFLQEPMQFGVPIQVQVPLMAAGGAGEARPIESHAEPLGRTSPQGDIAPEQAAPLPDPAPPQGKSRFLAALRDGASPSDLAGGGMEAGGDLSGSVISFTLAELFGHFSHEALPFDLARVSPKWKVNFPVDFITRQLSTGRVMATYALIYEGVEPEARYALAPFAGNQAEVAIPLREIFERLPAPASGVATGTPPGIGSAAAPAIFTEKGAGEAVPQEVFPGRFGPRQTTLEPMPAGGDLADAPEYVVQPVARREEGEEVASLDDLEESGVSNPGAGPGPAYPASRTSGHPGEVDGLPSRQVPDFSGLGFSAEPLADLELRAIFASHEVFTPQKAVERTAGLPGVGGAILFRRNGEIVACKLPDNEGARQLAERTPLIFQRTQNFVRELGFAESEAFTLHTDRGIVSFFVQGQGCLAILHGGQVFEPGMRERLMLIARGMASLLR